MEKPTVCCQWQLSCSQDRTERAPKKKKPPRPGADIRPDTAPFCLSRLGKAMSKYLQIKPRQGSARRAPCPLLLAPPAPCPSQARGGTEKKKGTVPGAKPVPAPSREHPACASQARCSNKERAPKLLAFFPIHDSKRLVENWFRNNPLVPPTHITECLSQQMHRKSPPSANGAPIPRTSSFGYSPIIWKPRCFYFPYRTGYFFFFFFLL